LSKYIIKMNVEQLHEELLIEIKSIANVIISVNSFSELIENEVKIQSLYEKFILVKNVNYFNIEKTENDIDRNVMSNDNDITIIHTIEFDKIEEVGVSVENELENEVKKETLEVSKSFPPKYLSKKINLDLNDRFAFISQLFNGNAQDLDVFIQVLNQTQSFQEAKSIIDTVKMKQNWTSMQDEFVERLEELNEKRFD